MYLCASWASAEAVRRYSNNLKLLSSWSVLRRLWVNVNSFSYLRPPDYLDETGRHNNPPLRFLSLWCDFFFQIERVAGIHNWSLNKSDLTSISNPPRRKDELVEVTTSLLGSVGSCFRVIIIRISPRNSSIKATSAWQKNTNVTHLVTSLGVANSHDDDGCLLAFLLIGPCDFWCHHNKARRRQSYSL